MSQRYGNIIELGRFDPETCRVKGQATLEYSICINPRAYHQWLYYMPFENRTYYGWRLCPGDATWCHISWSILVSVRACRRHIRPRYECKKIQKHLAGANKLIMTRANISDHAESQTSTHIYQMKMLVYLWSYSVWVLFNSACDE